MAFTQASAPLLQWFPQAGAACDLLVSPDVIGIVPSASGTAQSQLLVPPSLQLVGATFYHQMIPIVIGGQGDLISVTATNALQLTVGSL
jgi:hypothetical protein